MEKLRLHLLFSLIILILISLIACFRFNDGYFILLASAFNFIILQYLLGHTISSESWHDYITNKILSSRFNIWLFIILTAFIYPFLGLVQAIVYVRFNIIQNIKRLFWFNLLSPHFFLFTLAFFIGIKRAKRKLSRNIKVYVIISISLVIAFLVYSLVNCFLDNSDFIDILFCNLSILILAVNYWYILKLEVWKDIIKKPIPTPYKNN